MNFRLGLLTILLPVLASSCFDAELTVDHVESPAAVRISVPSASVPAGSQMQLSASGGTPPYQFSLDAGGVGSIDSETGLYSAPTTPGTAKLRVLDSVGVEDFVEVSVVAGPVATGQSNVAVDVANVLADGLATANVTVTIRDGYGNPVSGKQISLSSSRGGSDTVSPPSVTTNAAGQAIFSVKSTIAGASSYSASVVAQALVLTQNPSVQFLPGAVSPSVSTLSGTPLTVIANGTETSSITVTLKDAHGNAVSGKAVSLSSNRGGSDTLSPASAITNAAGQASFTVSSTVAGLSTISASDTTDALPLTATVNIQFVAGPVSAATSVVSASPVSVVADGGTLSTITVTLKDGNGNAVSSKQVSLSSSRGASDTISPASVTTNASGQAIFTVGSTVAGTSTISANDTTDSIGVTQTAGVTFVPGPVSASASTVTSSLSSLIADGVTSSTITVTLKDANGNLVSGKTVTLASSRGATDTIAPASVSSDALGRALFTVKSTVAGSTSFSAVGDGVAVTQAPAVQFVAGPVSAVSSTVVISGSPAVADGVSTATVTVTLKDAQGNAVSGKTVSLSSSRGASDTLSPSSAVSNASGQASFSVKTTLAGSAIMTAADSTDSIVITQTGSVQFVAGAVHAGVSTVTAAPTTLLANNTATSMVTVTLKDAYGNVVAGRSVSLSSSRGITDTISPASAVTDASGVASFTVKSSTGGSSTITARDVSASLNLSQTIGLQFITVISFYSNVTITAATLGSYSNSAWFINNGATVTLDLNTPASIYSLNIAWGGALTHSPCTITACKKIGLNVTENVTIEAGGRIDVDGKGYLGGYSGLNSSINGQTVSFAMGSSTDAGGSHGGYGGKYSGNPATVYGSFLTPIDHGGGGGGYFNTSGYAGGDGGGVVHLVIGGTLSHSGLITANGMTASNAGSGAGGSIWIQTPNAISGTGGVQANGGNLLTGGGGGGRVAIYAASFGGVSASAVGGSGNSGSYAGGAGTVYKKPSAGPGTLIFDNGGKFANYVYTKFELAANFNLAELIVDHGATVTFFPNEYQLSGTTYWILNSSILAIPASGSSFVFTEAGPGSSSPVFY